MGHQQTAYSQLYIDLFDYILGGEVKNTLSMARNIKVSVLNN
jgi:hypothetical protein